ncbi:EF-hand domain-containing protein [Streptomyces sclerotialus]|uniref:EF-hand domain-containing protein n=1 Tax=Streptomyces sclerotialus TaxID=1957 RepID=UPI0004C7A4A1
MPGSEFLDKKLSRRFETYDLDDNGVVERTDFVRAAERMAQEFGHAPASPEIRTLKERLGAVWNSLAEAADKDRDGRLTESEFKNAFHTKVIADDEGFRTLYEPFIQAAMDIADTDKDGRLGLDEHVRWYKALMGIPEEHSTAAFRKLDRNEDGYVTREEILAAVREYYFSEDPDAPGNSLLGPV